MAARIDLTQETLSSHLKRNAFIAQVHYFESVGSTNTIACQLALAGAREGEVVVADAQTKGKGRLNRTWQSPPGVNLYASVILRPAIEAAIAPQITLMAGVAVAELFSSCCPGNVSIKWPNDVLLGGRKACGILTEMKTVADRVDFIILGMGLNINIKREDFDPSLCDAATSLRMETGKIHDRLDMTSRLFDLIEKWYKVFLREGFPGLREAWLGHTDILGRRIQWVFKDESLTGVVTGIDDDGTLRMQGEDGASHRVIAGDIHLWRG